MIDILKAKKQFKEYVSNYNINDEKIELKIAHIERTSQIAKKLAKSLNLEKEDIELAELIGLLHDIGRFEQIKRYHTFIDKDSVNHGELGVEILFENNFIRKFIEDDSCDLIIKKSILNHNTAELEENLNERELLHAKLIRDADKIDIFYILTIDDKKTIWDSEDLSNDKISNEIYRDFIEGRLIDYKKRISSADVLVSNFAYVFDFYFKYSLEVIKDNNYLEKLYNRFTFKDKETMERYNNIYKMAKEYVEKNSLN